MKIDIEVAESIKQFLSLICSSWFFILFIHLIRMLVIFGQVCSGQYIPPFTVRYQKKSWMEFLNIKRLSVFSF